MSLTVVGILLVLFIIIFFLFRLGIRLFNNDLGDLKFWAWLVTIIGVFFGFSELNKNDPLGFLGFIPMLTYIILEISHSFNFSLSTTKKMKGGFFSILGMIVTYVITHTLFGFGIPEASIIAAISAAALGFMGFTA